ncbi:MAG: hypothetical protein ACR2NN_16095 [Bryobacteraceae bacterium]
MKSPPLDNGGMVVENRVSINFQLPAALSPEDYVKSITTTAELVPPEAARRLVSGGKVKKALKEELRRDRGDDLE